MYVGGLEESVREDVVRAAFIPFGDILDVQVPMDHVKQTNKGYAFVEFAEESDASDALDNMHNGELYGRVLRVTMARAPRARNKAVWADADEWYSSLRDAAEHEDAAGGPAAAMAVASPAPSAAHA